MPSREQKKLQKAIEERFECLRCGNCCKGDGVVRIGPEELKRMAAKLGITEKAFIKQYTMIYGEQEWWLIDKIVEEHGEQIKWCIFLEIMDDGLYGCRVNEAKPDQCASFPAKWRNNDSLRSCAGLRALRAELRKTS